ncbi:MAG TPA: sn-glycerol-3-phosphate ABC transporter ATP-binding protein UgpC, partial [Puia sp.]|nr:sn-glycerol-3-phosphate ABC transporter ATP-binding protein UgpC [Puia sp.]
MAELSLQNISKVYEGEGKRTSSKKAIDNISFTVQDREFMVLVGPSGCGKSTLLRMIAGLEDISEGELIIDGKIVNNLSPQERDIAMVFQNYALYPHMTVYENMAFGLRLKKFSKKEIQDRVMHAAELLEIEDELQRKPKALSGGQRQRVAIGRAIVRRPKIFLFDEPLSNLDAKLRSQMRIEFQKLHKQINATVVYVTHDQVEAMTLGNRIAVLQGGKLMQLDTPINLYNCPQNKFVASFIGSPTINIIKGKLLTNSNDYFLEMGTDVHLPIKSLQPHISENQLGQSLEIGIRPEHIDVSISKNGRGFLSHLVAYENMGNEQLLYFELNGQNLVARRFSQDVLQPGMKLFVELNDE